MWEKVVKKVLKIDGPNGPRVEDCPWTRPGREGSKGSKGKVNARSAGEGALPFGQKVVSPEGKRLTTFYASLSLL